ncbi:hypothetical protein PInf_008399 [Phytophthora infestans]|nr:hypothetical protein PInf_008399 [Phytophthora infestans]
MKRIRRRSSGNTPSRSPHSSQDDEPELWLGEQSCGFGPSTGNTSGVSGSLMAKNRGLLEPTKSPTPNVTAVMVSTITVSKSTTMEFWMTTATLVEGGIGLFNSETDHSLDADHQDGRAAVVGQNAEAVAGQDDGRLDNNNATRKRPRDAKWIEQCFASTPIRLQCAKFSPKLPNLCTKVAESDAEVAKSFNETSHNA